MFESQGQAYFFSGGDLLPPKRECRNPDPFFSFFGGSTLSLVWLLALGVSERRLADGDRLLVDDFLLGEDRSEVLLGLHDDELIAASSCNTAFEPHLSARLLVFASFVSVRFAVPVVVLVPASFSRSLWEPLLSLSVTLRRRRRWWECDPLVLLDDSIPAYVDTLYSRFLILIPSPWSPNLYE